MIYGIGVGWRPGLWSSAVTQRGEVDGFHDRNARYSYLVACIWAEMIRAGMSTLEMGRDHLERFARDDPGQAEGYRLWTGLLAEGEEAVAARLVERSARGDYARQTAPNFGALPPKVRTELLRRARQPLPPSDVGVPV